MQDRLATPQTADLDKLRKAATAFIGQNRFAEAEAAARTMLQNFPEEPDGWVFRARIAQRRNDFDGAANSMKKALALAPDRLDVQLVAAESDLYVGRIAEAIKALGDIENNPQADEEVFRRLSGLYTQLGRHEGAYRTAVKARDRQPQSINFAYLVASAAIAVGKMDEAETLLDELIEQSPEEGDTYYNRATLKKQTPNANHIDGIRKRISATSTEDPRLAPLYYALGKELEDLGEYEDAFEAFAKGAKARRVRLAYDVSTDVQAMEDISKVFDEDWLDRTSDGSRVEGPVFILGLPRSGTTLVDRILSAHSAVASLGEVNDFAYAVVRAGAPAASKQDLMRNSAKSNMTTLGNAVWTALRGYGEHALYLIDKTPANYLYLGLIAKALPNARIVHVRRHPLASGFAMFKTLFRMGYPFSYDLKDIGHYYAAYYRLMDHWRGLYPGRILDIQYEDLVDDQERLSKAIIAHCGLEWEEACLQFHKNAAPTATASAAQVRQPLYRDARDLWRTHEAALQPLASVLKESGIPCD